MPNVEEVHYWFLHQIGKILDFMEDKEIVNSFIVICRIKILSNGKNVCEIVWIQGLLLDLGVQVDGSSELFCDNDAALKLAANPVFHEKTKHIKVDCHFT